MGGESDTNGDGDTDEARAMILTYQIQTYNDFEEPEVNSHFVHFTYCLKKDTTKSESSSESSAKDMFVYE